MSYEWRWAFCFEGNESITSRLQSTEFAPLHLPPALKSPGVGQTHSMQAQIQDVNSSILSTSYEQKAQPPTKTELRQIRH